MNDWRPTCDAPEFKLAEADFFLERFRVVGSDVMAAKFFASAFVSAARSVTFALQAAHRSTSGFDEWYKIEQGILATLPHARAFVATRNRSVHAGIDIVPAGTLRNGVVSHHFRDNNGGTEPFLPAATDYLKALLGMYARFVQKFPETIVPGGFSDLGNSEDERLQMLRQAAAVMMYDPFPLFDRYGVLSAKCD